MEYQTLQPWKGGCLFASVILQPYAKLDDNGMPKVQLGFMSMKYPKDCVVTTYGYLLQTAKRGTNMQESIPYLFGGDLYY